MMRDALDQLVSGKIPYLLVGENLSSHSVLLPGSFNPLHAGHKGLLKAAEQITERDGYLELSIANVDKSPLDAEEVERRLAVLEGQYSVILTCAPTFVEKAELFPGAWFALGYDTAIRLLSPKYHDDVPAMLARFMALKTRFIVAGRLHAGEFQGVEGLEIPVGFEELFIPIPESVFREDISSTELRLRAIGS
ncbi:MAG: hypothetical protein ABFR47_09525 [Verrucomicrobiota bacterium]